MIETGKMKTFRIAVVLVIVPAVLFVIFWFISNFDQNAPPEILKESCFDRSNINVLDGELWNDFLSEVEASEVDLHLFFASKVDGYTIEFRDDDSEQMRFYQVTRFGSYQISSSEKANEIVRVAEINQFFYRSWNFDSSKYWTCLDFGPDLLMHWSNVDVV